MNLDPISWAGLGLSMTCFGGFVWAIKSVFESSGGHLSWRMRVLSGLGSMFFIAQLSALASPCGDLRVVRLGGLALFVSSLVLFWCCVPIARQHKLKLAYSHSEPTELVIRGPYRWIRHPFYSA